MEGETPPNMDVNTLSAILAEIESIKCRIKYLDATVGSLEVSVSTMGRKIDKIEVYLDFTLYIPQNFHALSSRHDQNIFATISQKHFTKYLIHQDQRTTPLLK